LLLHHVEELAPVEIARRLAIPAGTVRWRLKVAHDELRDRLIARSGGDRDAWRLALLPLAKSARRPPIGGDEPPPGRTVPGKGATTMVTWKMMALLGATLAVTGAAVHHGARPGTTPAAAAATPTNANRGAATAHANAETPPLPAGPASSLAVAGATTSSPSRGERAPHHRAFAVPSASISDFVAPDLDACFAAAAKSATYKRIDLTLALAAAGPTATITDVRVKRVSDELAGTPDLADCLRRKLVGHDMPAPNGNGPAALAVLVYDDCPRGSSDEPGPAGVGALAADLRAPSLGEPNARLTITVFTEFQCAFCWMFAARLQSLAQLYPGQVRIELRNFPLPIHDKAELAAEAALAAHEQGKFWPMHDELFANQSTIDREHLRALAQKLGLDVARFDQALDDGHERARVQSDLELGRRLGVRGVPATVIGDELVPGAQPLEELVRRIDRALAAKRP
jgi:protein-disulfide isomerase